MEMHAAAWHKHRVPDDDANPQAEEDRPILPWTLIAGAFLHFAVPVYLIAVVVDALLAAPKDAGAEAVLRHALSFSGWFLAVYGVIALAVSLAAVSIDPLLRARRRRSIRNHPLADARLSERRLTHAVAQGRGLFGPHADAALRALQSARWDHGDPRFRSLSGDLDDVVRTSAAALTSAAAERHTGIGARAAGAIIHLQDALHDLNRLQEGRHDADAEAVARYVALRYGPSDFSGSDD